MLKTNIGSVFKVFLNPPTLGKDKNIPAHLVNLATCHSRCFLRTNISRWCPLNCFFQAFDRLDILGFRQCAPNQRKGQEPEALVSGGSIRAPLTAALQHPSLCFCSHKSLRTQFLQGRLVPLPLLYRRPVISSRLLKIETLLQHLCPSNVSKSGACSALNQTLILWNKEDHPSLVKSHRWQMFGFIPFGRWQWQIQSCYKALRLCTSS